MSASDVTSSGKWGYIYSPANIALSDDDRVATCTTTGPCMATSGGERNVEQRNVEQRNVEKLRNVELRSKYYEELKYF